MMHLKVMHDANKSTNETSSNCPRGYRELNGFLSKRFTLSDARELFENKGMQLKIEKIEEFSLHVAHRKQL